MGETFTEIIIDDVNIESVVTLVIPKVYKVLILSLDEI